MSEKKPFVDNKIGQVKVGKKKDENGNFTGPEYFYLDFEKDVAFKKGDRVFLQDSMAGIDSRVKKGAISKDEGDALKEKLSFLLFDVTLPAKKS